MGWCVLVSFLFLGVVAKRSLGDISLEHGMQQEKGFLLFVIQHLALGNMIEAIKEEAAPKICGRVQFHRSQ